VKGKKEATRVSTVVLGADPEALAEHAAVLEDFYAGSLTASDERLTRLAERLPALAGYYGKLTEKAVVGQSGNKSQ